MAKKIEKSLISVWQQKLQKLSPQAILLWANEIFGARVGFATSLGLEDQILTDMIFRNNQTFPIFTLDTGRLFNHTYDLIHRTEDLYGIKIQIFFPDAGQVESMVGEFGINLFLKSAELRKYCCEVRKINPLKRALSGLDAWICGLRREQSITRADLEFVELDGLNGLVKINPLLNWREADIWSYIKRHKVPYNPLHDKGFASIGCACCTRAISKNEDTRSGRWWWEQPEKKECGLHQRTQAPAFVKKRKGKM